MKKLNFIYPSLLSFALIISSCSKNDPSPNPTNVDCNGIENGIATEDDCGTCQQSYMYAGMGQLTYVATYADTAGVDGDFVLAGSAIDIASNPLWNAGCVSAPENYEFLYNGQSTVAYSGQTIRLMMAKQLTDALKNGTHDLSQLVQMWTTGTGFADGLDNSSKILRSKTSASATASATVQVQLDELLETYSNEVLSNWSGNASAGVGGEYTTPGRTVHIDNKGREIDQLFAKSLIGALCFDQTSNKYTEASYQAGLNNTDRDPAEDNNATEMEHKWDEGFGYVYGMVEGNTTGDLSTDALLGKYLNKYGDKVPVVFDAFKLGRAAIVGSDYTLRDAQSAIIKTELSEVIVGKTVGYLESAADELEANGITADYFHDLSEGWGFILSLQYTDWFSNSEVNSMLEQLDAGNGFWDRTAAELDAMAAQILAVTGPIN
tara:strand:+ start:1348 stop:2652 length:1305 start_codon:yes stop_codon:yes gene_type:complete